MIERTAEIIEAARDVRDWLVEALNRRANGGDVDEVLKLAHDRLERMNLGDGDPDQTPNGSERWSSECGAGTGARNEHAVERLDYSNPPPGYVIDAAGGDLHDDQGDALSSGVDEAETVAAAWAHYKARRDPPGLEVFVWPKEKASDPPTAWYVGFRRAVNARQSHDARVGAWAWYDRRLALFARFESLCSLLGMTDVVRYLDFGALAWPDVLQRPDDMVEHTERQLAVIESEVGEMEVLRG